MVDTSRLGRDALYRACEFESHLLYEVIVYASIAQLVRADDSCSSGQWFESI